MKITASQSRFKVQCLRFLQRKSVTWKVMIISFLAFIFIIAKFMDNVTYRPKTKITFVNKNLCFSHADGNDDQKTVVIIVNSGRNHFDRRKVIRDTYGTVRLAHNVQILDVVFMLGNSDAPGSVVTDEHRLQEERNQFGDIVMGDFVDAYRNLSLKAIMSFEWLTTYCRKAQILVKTDDDTFINVYQLTKELESWSPTEVISPNIWCLVDKYEKTINDKSSKYYASPVDFPNGIFPDHCEGLGWITSIQVIDRILDEIRKSFPRRVCTHDDVFITGIVRRHINSNMNYFWRKPEPIQLVNKMSLWRSIDLQDGRGDEDYFLRNFIERATLDIESLYKFRVWYDKKIFYLITHSDNLCKQFVQLWKIVKAAYEIDSL